MTGNDTFTQGTRAQYTLDAKGVPDQVMGHGQLQLLQQALKNPGTIYVREVTYGQWHPYGTREARMACSEPHNGLSACSRCGYDPLPNGLP
jgi:hypothetical protein